jgi:hypothetical protein
MTSLISSRFAISASFARTPVSNSLFDTDTHRQCAARRVDEPTPCGAVPVLPGQRRRYQSTNFKINQASHENLIIGSVLFKTV